MNSTKRISVALVGLAFLGLLAVTAYGLLFTRFMIYDDEGYVLWSVRQFCEGHALYREVFSQYGPFFYAYYSVIQAVTALPFDNETGRWLTLAYWLVASIACGAIALRLTRSLIAGLAGAGFAFAVLADMTCEPFHPGGLLTAMMALGAVAGLFFPEKHRSRTILACGLLGIAMALTKVNVGAVFLIAAASWLLLHHRTAASLRLYTRVIALGVLLAPFMLMRAHWPAAWVGIYALIFVGSGLALLACMVETPPAESATGLRRALLATALAMSAAVVVIALLTRCSPALLFEAVFLAPLRHPGVYSFPVDWLTGAAPAAVVALLVFAADRRWRRHAWRPRAIAALRLVAGGWFLFQARESDTGMLHRLTFQFGPTLAWLMATPLRPDQPDSAAHGRSWIAWLSLWQMLQAYPVAGTQQAWAAFTWAPLLIAGWWDAAHFWSENFRRPRLLVVVAGAILIGATAVAVGQMTRWAQLYYSKGEPLGLPGAARLRVQEDLSTGLRVLHRNIRAHGGTLFTFPGMFSFNIWTDKPTPTAANVTHWFSLLNDGQQEAIIARLKADRGALLVVHRIHVHYLISTGFAPRGPLKDYLLQNFQPVIRVGHYDLWVHRGRNIAPLATARIETYPEDRRFLNLVVGANTAPIAQLQIRQLNPSHQVVRIIAPGPTRPWQVAPIDTDGRALAPPRPQTEAFRVDGTSRVQVPLDPAITLPDLSSIEVVLTDVVGKIVETLRFNEAPGLTPADAPPAAN